MIFAGGALRISTPQSLVCFLVCFYMHEYHFHCFSSVWHWNFDLTRRHELVSSSCIFSNRSLARVRRFTTQKRKLYTQLRERWVSGIFRYTIFVNNKEDYSRIGTNWFGFGFTTLNGKPLYAGYMNKTNYLVAWKHFPVTLVSMLG